MNREEYLSYMKEYNRLYKGAKRVEANGEYRYTFLDLKIEPTENNFIGNDNDEPRCCSQFGCGKKLSMEEQRFGNYCINHQNKNKLDITNYISHPIKKSA